MTVTGSVRCDLTAVREDRHRQRVAAVLANAPDRVRLILIVGALAPGMPAFDLLMQHTDRLSIDIQGEPRAVRQWVEALRSGDILAASGWSP